MWLGRVFLLRSSLLLSLLLSHHGLSSPPLPNPSALPSCLGASWLWTDTDTKIDFYSFNLQGVSYFAQENKVMKTTIK